MRRADPRWGYDLEAMYERDRRRRDFTTSWLGLFIGMGMVLTVALVTGLIVYGFTLLVLVTFG